MLACIFMLCLTACGGGEIDVSQVDESSQSADSSIDLQDESSKPWYDTSVPDSYVSEGWGESITDTSSPGSSIPDIESSVPEQSLPENTVPDFELCYGEAYLSAPFAKGFKVVYTKESALNATAAATNFHIAVTAIYDGSVTRFFDAKTGEYYCAKSGKYLHAASNGFIAGDRNGTEYKTMIKFSFTEGEPRQFLSADEEKLQNYGAGEFEYTFYSEKDKAVYTYQKYGTGVRIYEYTGENCGLICRELEGDYDKNADWKGGKFDFPKNPNGKYGVVIDGKVVIPFEYDYIATYVGVSDLANSNTVDVVLAEKDGRSYYFSADGTNLTPDGFDCGSEPFANRAWVFEDGNGWIIEFN